MSWTAGPVRVRVPATSANLGPGFDSLGLALTLYDEVEVEVTAGGLSIEVTGEGAEVADRGEDHLIIQVVRRAFDFMGERAGSVAEQPGLRLRCVNRIPHSRGLGSSSAAIVAGLTAARALHPYGQVLDDQASLVLAAEIEGHPDNVAPCLVGGLTIAWSTAEGAKLTRLDVDMEVVVFVPDQRLATERARGLLPAVVPHGDAAVNAARAALLIAALTRTCSSTASPTAASPTAASPTAASPTAASPTAPPMAAPDEPPGLPAGSEMLMAATEDRLHQQYRAPAMPESAALLSRLRAVEIPAVVSGAGPAVLAFTTAAKVDSTELEVGNGWHKRPLNVDPHGAHVQLIHP